MDEIEEGVLPNLKRSVKPDPVQIKGPLTFWIGLLILAMILEISSVLLHYKLLDATSQLIINIPGDIILPLITAVWIGERVSKYANSISSAAKRGAINATYATVVYVISIFIIYIILTYSNSLLFKITLNNFLIFLIAIPIGIVMVLVPVFAILSTARKIT